MCREIWFQKQTTNLLAIKKAAYVFLDRCSVEIVEQDDAYKCVLRSADIEQTEVGDALVEQFRIEVLDQELRVIISRETEGIRNLILAYTFSEVELSSDE